MNFLIRRSLTLFHPLSRPKSLHFSTVTTTTTTTTTTNDDKYSAATNEFLSRFVHRMRPNLIAAFASAPKPNIDAMLLVIINHLLPHLESSPSQRPLPQSLSPSLNDDLWTSVLQVSQQVHIEMEREHKKETMKHFLQSDHVKSMARFASEVGVRGDMLRELTFKWAREAMEEKEFYQALNRIRVEDENNEDVVIERERDVEGLEELPKRVGKMRYEIYGLDFSGSEWDEVGQRVNEASLVLFDRESKPVMGKCKVVTEKIVGLSKDDELLALLGEWKKLMQPGRAEWVWLLERVKERDLGLYLKV